MAESLTGADGQPVPMDPAEQQFAAAMAAPEPGERPDYPAPPKVDKTAPFGRDDKGVPIAPHGVKPDGTPRMNRPGPGRPKRDAGDQPRVQKPGTQQKPASAKPKPPADADTSADVRVRRAGDAQTTLELLGAGASLLAMIGSAKAQARYQAAQARQDEKAGKAAAESAERAAVLQLDAAACSIHAEPVGASLADMADQNSWAAAIVDRLALVNGIASVGMALLPLVYQLTANHAPAQARDNLPPELMTLGVLPPQLLMEKLSAQNAVKMAKAQTMILAEKAEAEAELAELRDRLAA